MKNKYLAAAVLLALTLTAAACSSGNNKEPQTSEAAEETTVESSEAQESQNSQESLEESSAQEAGAEASGEELDEDYFYGKVVKTEGNTVTIEDEEGTQAVFDVSGAEFSDDVEIRQGDDIEITFLGTLSQGTTAAVYVDFISSAALEESEAESEEEDPTISGVIQKAENGSVTLETDEGTYTFDTSIAQKVTLGGIVSGTEADITYYGDLDDEEILPMATRIVTEDAADSADADMFTLTGTAVEVNPASIVLETPDKDKTLFVFEGTEGMFNGISPGDTATIIYEGTLTARVVKALGVQ